MPYDGTSTWLKGADRGPDAILEASAHLELYDIETDTELYRHGILTDPPVDGVRLARGHGAGRASSGSPATWRRARFPVVLGGEHSVTIGAVQAAAAR